MKIASARFVLVAGAALLASTQLASAGTVYCAAISATTNYMGMPDTQADACLASGTGNLSGNPANDGFLVNAAGSGYSLLSKSDG
ncbi:MAG: hypothetical protein ACR2I8_04435 [Steroidobacteraceae bacterium]